LINEYTGTEDFILFFEEEGMIGIGTPGTRVGNIICTFEGTDVVAILRKIDAKYAAISKGEEFRTLPKRKVSSELVALDLDIAFLMSLTDIFRYEPAFKDYAIEKGLLKLKREQERYKERVDLTREG